MFKRPKLITIALVVALASAMATRAMAGQLDDTFPKDTFKVSYYDVATSAAASRSGYGGPGLSGGAGDNTVRIINGFSGLSEADSLCAMIYVFDDFEEMQTCCGCPVTPDGMRTLSVVNDLTFDFGVNKGNLNAGVIRIISSFPNFAAIIPPPGPNPPGTNVQCSPTGSFSNDPFHRTAPVFPHPGLRAYITHDESIQPGNIAGGHVASGVSVEEFLDAPVDPTELTNLQQTCQFLISNGSGTGVCTCGTGDNPAPIPFK